MRHVREDPCTASPFWGQFLATLRQAIELEEVEIARLRRVIQWQRALGHDPARMQAQHAAHRKAVTRLYGELEAHLAEQEGQRARWASLFTGGKAISASAPGR